MRPRRILVASLLIQNPTTAAEHGGATDDSFAVEREATTGLRRSRRTRSPHVAACAALVLPEEIVVWEIFIRLPAKDILRCRAVCRYWRGLTSAHDFLRAHHRRQPSLPLVTLYGTITSTEGDLPFLERGRAVLGFDDYERFKLLASCDGLLLISLTDGCYSICNPVTHQCAPLPCLTAAGRINIAALYLHGPSGEYRVLYWKGRHQDHLRPAYYILMVRRGCSSRCIGVPSDDALTKLMLAAYGMPPTNYAPPVMFRNCLHWIPGFPSHLGNGSRIVVFDTVIESFRLMRGPDGATRSCTLLCDMEGSIGFSCFDDGSTVAKIWLLEDYEREVWSFKYHVNFPVESLCRIEDGHWFKENLVKQDISLRRGCGCVKQLRFFQRI